MEAWGGPDGSPVEARQFLEQQLQQDPANEDLAQTLSEVLKQQPANIQWSVLRPAEMTSAGGAVLTPQTDGSILVSGTNVDADVYTLILDKLPSSITSLRLDALADSRLPGGGPGRHESGNFQLAEISFHTMQDGDDDQEAPVAIANATDSYHWTGEPIVHAIDNNPDTIWHVWGQIGKNHVAIFQLKEPFVAGSDDRLVVRLQHSSREPGINLGRFRLVATDHPLAAEVTELNRYLEAGELRGFEALGARYFIHGDYAQVIAHLAKAAGNPRGQSVTELLLLALAHRELEQFEQAREHYDQAIEQLPYSGNRSDRRLMELAMARFEGLGAEAVASRIDGLGTRLQWVSAADAKCPPSRTSSQQTIVVFENQRDSTVSLLWVDFDGKRQSFGHLQPNETRPARDVLDAFMDRNGWRWQRSWPFYRRPPTGPRHHS